MLAVAELDHPGPGAHRGVQKRLGVPAVWPRVADEVEPSPSQPLAAQLADGLGRCEMSRAGRGVDKSYGIPDQAKFMPTTTVPQFQLGAIAEVFSSICSQLPEAPAGRGNRGGDSTGRRGQRGGAGAAASTSTPFQTCVGSRVSTPVGMHKTNATADGQVHSNVDELYRLALGLENPRTFARDTTSGDSSGSGRSFDSARGWQADSYHGVSRLGAFALPGGMRSAFIRIPEKRASIIILTGDDAAAAKVLADRITDQLLTAKKR
jgi:hypothetical protein